MTRPARCHLCGARLAPGTRVRKWNVWTCKDGKACCARQGGEKAETAMTEKKPKLSAFAREMLRGHDNAGFNWPDGSGEHRSCYSLYQKGFMDREHKGYRTNAAGRAALAGSEGKGK